MLIIIETLFLLLAFLDVEFTKRRLFEYGIETEINPLIRWLCRKIGINYGVDLGILSPTGIIAIAGWYFPQILWFVLGVRFCLFVFQQQSRYIK